MVTYTRATTTKWHDMSLYARNITTKVYFSQYGTLHSNIHPFDGSPGSLKWVSKISLKLIKKWGRNRPWWEQVWCRWCGRPEDTQSSAPMYAPLSPHTPDSDAGNCHWICSHTRSNTCKDSLLLILNWSTKINRIYTKYCMLYFLMYHYTIYQMEHLKIIVRSCQS